MRSPSFGHEIGLAFQLLDDVLDVAGPPERTGKARGTDLLDGTVTLPLILARERDPALAELDLRSLDARSAEAACDRIAATGALEEVRADARGRVAEAKRERRIMRSARRRPSAGCWRWSPTAWSSATPSDSLSQRLVPGRLRDARSLRGGSVRLERLRKRSTGSPCSPA